MNAYLDSSIVLRLVLNERNHLRSWRELSSKFASVLTKVECLRVLDRYRCNGALSVAEYARRKETAHLLLEDVTLFELHPAVLDRAADSLPVGLGTLAALHLATALRLRELSGAEFAFATHDELLAAAARIYRFPVIGLETR